MAPTVIIEKHTTASSPRPHVLYNIEVNIGGKELTTQRRYSEFVDLHNTLKDPYNLPPKRLFATTFIPSAWVDDSLIAERKAGLAEYLVDILSTPKYKDQPAVFEFLSAQTLERNQKFDLEDALPSTLTRKKAISLAAGLSDGVINTAASLIAGGYYTYWSESTNPPENIDFSKFDMILFAFALPSSSNTVSMDSSQTSLLKRLVSAARSSGYGTRIVISIGGWGGCYYFSQACSTSTNRTKFINSIASTIKTYNLDGEFFIRHATVCTAVDSVRQVSISTGYENGDDTIRDPKLISLQQEFPNSPGAGQPYSASDTNNFLLLLQALRVSLGPSKVISGAVSHQPWLGSNGNPLTDVSAFAKVMNYVNIMNYDVWGASSTPGPNAPLGDLCKTSTQPSASAQAAFATWTKAKFPANQIILGLPLYGYVSQSSKTVLTGSSVPAPEMLILEQKEMKDEDGTVQIHFLNGAHVNNLADVKAPEEEAAVAAAAAANLTQYWGQQIAFKDIVKAGALAKGSDGNYGQAGGFTMAWDNCSDTPFLFNKAQTTVVTYDDTWSLADKAQFVKSSGMAGCLTWSIDQASFGDDGITLHNAIRKALGK